ncbi:MAG: hypothetical protein JO092_10175 [Candidatus Eremiobacteraeota bacterium]|nr:hypothetical protein [Candidatus Eremiobacteraeota bacterium]
MKPLTGSLSALALASLVAGGVAACTNGGIVPGPAVTLSPSPSPARSPSANRCFAMRGSTMNVLRAAYSTMFVAIGAAVTGVGCSASDPAVVCSTPAESAPMLVYPRSGATVMPADIGILLYGNVGRGTVPIEVVAANANVDTLPTSLPSPLPSPTATPPPGEKSWGPVHAVEIRPLLPPRTYEVEATVTRYSCPPGPTQHQVQVKIGSFKLVYPPPAK